MRITDKINDNTSLDTCKGPPTLEVVENPAAESSLASENAVSEVKNDCAACIEDLEDESMDTFSVLGVLCLT